MFVEHPPAQFTLLRLVVPKPETVLREALGAGKTGSLARSSRPGISARRPLKDLSLRRRAS